MSVVTLGTEVVDQELPAGAIGLLRSCDTYLLHLDGIRVHSGGIFVLRGVPVLWERRSSGQGW